MAQLGHAKRALEAGNLKVWHLLRWQEIASRNELDREWVANSYEDGTLDVYGVSHPVVEDFRLRDLVAPWIGRESDAESDTRPPPQSLGFCLEQRPAMVKSTLARMSPIEGWLTEPEAALLMAATALALIRAEARPVVEIGSYCGRSTVVLGAVVKTVCPEARVHAIDPHEGEVARDIPAGPSTLERFLKNINDAGLADVVELIPKRSFEVAWSQQIGFLFIDGLHDYDNVARDFAHFQGWLTPSSYVGFHDYDRASPGVVDFVDQLLASGTYREFQRAGSLVVLERSTSMQVDDTQNPESRLERYEKGVTVLRDLLRAEMSRGEAEAAERDKRIVELQEELFAKVGERDRIINDLQAELHSKVGECNRIIRELQAELHEKVGDRDSIIRSLQAQLGSREKGEARG
jgi:predicted O-methyltransferase YrrM